MKKASFAAALSFALLGVGAPALAAETGGCGAFKWPVGADIALLAKPDWVDSGATVDLSGPVGVRVKLVDADKAGFAIPSERKPALGAPAGTLGFEARAGVTQVTLSDAAWADLVQDGKPVKPTGFSGVKDCDGAHKTLRFELGAGPALLQISNAPATSIGIALTPPAK
ncbi:MAG TPA: hypothetical protein VGC51_10995 [Hansschlegelia sp.]